VGRAFISAPIPAQVVVELRRLNRSQPEVRWTNPDQWHVTLQFIEHCDIEVVEESFLQITAKSPTAVLGPRIALLGKNNLVVPVGGLTDLAHQVQKSMEPHESLKNQFSFVGHLTLGRLKDANRAELEGTPLLGSFVVTELELVQSVLGAGGPTHTTVNRLSLLPQFE
jgi:2'-5' RNA ligase